MLGPETRLLRRADFGPNNYSYLPDMKATSIDQEAFILSYHCHTPINLIYELPTKKRRIMIEMLKEQKELEKREMDKASKKK